MQNMSSKLGLIEEAVIGTLHRELKSEDPAAENTTQNLRVATKGRTESPTAQMSGSTGEPQGADNKSGCMTWGPGNTLHVQI